MILSKIFKPCSLYQRFSYQCGGNYHAPTDCETIKRWLTKCADDSETANYISAHTKDVSNYTIKPLLFLENLIYNTYDPAPVFSENPI